MVTPLMDTINTMFFGIGLPSGDVGTDINLGIRLSMYGHPKWAMCVLAPVVMNTFFTLFACARIDKDKWLWYIPLVLLQVYPQYCVVRIVLQYLRSKLDREQFIEKRDQLDGGLGCLESYVEAVPQAFIQTAFFTIANSLTSTVTRLCYNDNAQSCAEFLSKTCMIQKRCSDMGFDGNHCNPVGFNWQMPDSHPNVSYHHNSNEKIRTCNEQTNNCTKMFDICIQPFYQCLGRCEENLTSQIDLMDELEFYQSLIRNNSNYSDIFLSSGYDASKEDLQGIQLYLLFIGDKATFLCTYAISIFAAAYGVTKFFRLSYSRHCDKIDYLNTGLNVKTFGVTFIIATVYLLAKGFALSLFMLINENNMATNVTLWLLYCMLPSFMFASFSFFVRTFHQNKSKGLGSIKYPLTIFLKEPPVIGASLVTPFMYSPQYVDRSEEITISSSMEGNVSNKKKCVIFGTKMIYSHLDYGLSYANNFISVCVGTIGITLSTDHKLEVVLPAITIFFIITTILLFIVAKLDNGGSKKCFEHAAQKSECIECTKKYGLYIEYYQRKIMCAAHRQDIPCHICGKVTKDHPILSNFTLLCSHQVYSKIRHFYRFT